MSDIQQILLKKLEEYGDSLLDNEDYKRRKRKANQMTKVSSAGADKKTLHTVGNSQSPEGAKSRKKRRKKKKKGETSESSQTGERDSVLPKKGVKSHLEQLNEQLGLRDFKQELEKAKEKHQTQQVSSGPEVVVFQSHKKKVKEIPVTSEPDKVEQPIFDMKKSRFDVHKFGVGGLTGTDKSNAKIELLVKLGAKPPKKEYINYKKFQEMRKTQIEQEKLQAAQDKKDKIKTGKKPVTSAERKKKRKDRNDVGRIDGQVGQYRAGVLSIKKSDLKGLRKSAIKR